MTPEEFKRRLIGRTITGVSADVAEGYRNTYRNTPPGISIWSLSLDDGTVILIGSSHFAEAVAETEIG